MNVIVCGTRGAMQEHLRINLAAELDGLPEIFRIMHGACPDSADIMAVAWAKENNVYCESFPAAWDTLGKQAGHMRNQSMADYADMLPGESICIAVWDGNSHGTLSMIKRAVKKGFRVRIIAAEMIPKVKPLEDLLNSKRDPR